MHIPIARATAARYGQHASHAPRPPRPLPTQRPVRGAALLASALCALVVAAPAPAHAGRACDRAQPPALRTIERGMALAQRTAAALDAEHARAGTQVVLLGRAGQDLSAYGLRYSHLGWAYKTPQGPWRIVHKLNDCGTAVGQVYRQGLGEFFMDDLHRYEAVWAVPTPAVQQHLLAVLPDNARARVLQHRPYSMVSYAWGQRYQQSNQWAIETLAAAMEPATIRTRDQAQAWLQFKGYVPTTLHIRALQRLGARVGSAHIAFDDHPPRQRFANQIETVTADSVLDWLQRTQWTAAPVVLPEK